MLIIFKLIFNHILFLQSTLCEEIPILMNMHYSFIELQQVSVMKEETWAMLKNAMSY